MMPRTTAERLYGVEASPRRAHDAAALAALLPYVEAMELDEGAARHYAEIRADLKRRGVMIGASDLFIAAHARVLGSRRSRTPRRSSSGCTN